MPQKRDDIEDILKKYKREIESKISQSDLPESGYSKEYLQFKKERIPTLSHYEKLCKSLGSIIKIRFSEKDTQKIQKYIDIAHLDIEPWQPLSLSVVSFVFLIFIGIVLSTAISLIKGGLEHFPFVLFFLVFISSFFVFYFLNGYPARLANKWRLKASSQMVPAILYIVVYMRHTPNLERAIAFASQNLQPPLSLDLKKVFYDVEIGKFPTIKESLDNYLETWRDYCPEFIESFHLIESSLYEPDNSRRIFILEKAMNSVLDGIYDKMLTFTHNVKSPLTNVYMLGIVLPTLGLALLPLASAMLGGLINWIYVLLLFNFIIPLFVFYLTDKVIFLRPGGHGDSSLIEKNPYYSRYKSIYPYILAFFISIPFFIIGFLPFIFQYTSLPELFGFQKDYTFAELGFGFLGNGSIFGFVKTEDGLKGPFGIVALIFGMFIPLGCAVFFSTAFSIKTKELIVAREDTRRLESEFSNSLFQVGNRIGSGAPLELVFGKVAESSKGLKTEGFFKLVDYNIRQMGASVEKAIFDSEIGALRYYPSELISTSMKILVESSKKGLSIAAVSMMSISEYTKNLQKISARLKDMLAEVVSDMKSNMGFLAPLLAGVVVGLSLMISEILMRLTSVLKIGGGQSIGEFGGFLGGFKNLLSIFDVTQIIPPYFLQIIIGIYLLQIIFILTRTLVIIDSGDDTLQTTYTLAKNFRAGLSLYFLTAFFSTCILFVLVSVVMGGIL
ncbi:MAG: hypothetical protein QXU40_00490 [Candidatus Pacearchaeota archaeon]